MNSVKEFNVVHVHRFVGSCSRCYRLSEFKYYWCQGLEERIIPDRTYHNLKAF